MTIAIAMKINNGIILATDSSSTILGKNENGDDEVHHTYYTADKIFNLKKGSPIGAISWGDGSINNDSISTLAKDFRKKNDDEVYSSVIDISNKFSEFLKNKISSETNLGFLIAGYSLDTGNQNMFLINVNNGNIETPIEINKDNPLAVSWFGNTQFLTRLLLGFDEKLPSILKENDVPAEDIEDIINECTDNLQLPLGVPAMPIQDAIDLVKFLADISVKSSRFTPGAQLIGGPIDIAVITKHEGFKWIERKHYYDKELNKTTGGI